MNISQLRLSAMRALWGVVTPNLRKVCIQEKNNNICLYFYYDKEPSEKEVELSEDAATIVIADFLEPFTISCERKVVSFPKKIDWHDDLIYFRYEETEKYC